VVTIDKYGMLHATNGQYTFKPGGDPSYYLDSDRVFVLPNGRKLSNIQSAKLSNLIERSKNCNNRLGRPVNIYLTDFEYYEEEYGIAWTDKDIEEHLDRHEKIIERLESAFEYRDFLDEKNNNNSNKAKLNLENSNFRKAIRNSINNSRPDNDDPFVGNPEPEAMYRNVKEFTERKLVELGLFDWQVKFNSNPSRWFGRTQHHPKVIEFNARQFETMTPEERLDTVNHELAHALSNGDQCPYGETWRKYARLLRVKISNPKEMVTDKGFTCESKCSDGHVWESMGTSDKCPICYSPVKHSQRDYVPEITDSAKNAKETHGFPDLEVGQKVDFLCEYDINALEIGLVQDAEFSGYRYVDTVHHDGSIVPEREYCVKVTTQHLDGIGTVEDTFYYSSPVLPAC